MKRKITKDDLLISAAVVVAGGVMALAALSPASPDALNSGAAAWSAIAAFPVLVLAVGGLGYWYGQRRLWRKIAHGLAAVETARRDLGKLPVVPAPIMEYGRYHEKYFHNAAE